MNILYCGDKNIADGTILSVLSLTKHVKEPLHIYILTASVETAEKTYMSLPPSFAVFLDHYVKKCNISNSVKLFDITEQFAKCLPTVNLETRFTPCCMLRLYADLVPEIPQKILYLDNDVICRVDPQPFYHQDMSDWEIAGVLDYYGGWLFRKKPFRRDYLNSGVLLLNFEKIRETDLFARARKACMEEKMFMPDQSALNRLSAHKKICPRRYNEQRKLHDDTVFQHFTTSFRLFPYFHSVSVKPWDVERLHSVLKLHEYDDLIKEYQQLKENYHESK